MKGKVIEDVRYDAVGSSSLREELFNTYLKAHGADATPEPISDKKADESVHNLSQDSHMPEEEDAERERKKRERKERAVQEREQRVRAERSKVEADIDRSRMGLNKEEGGAGIQVRRVSCEFSAQLLGAAH